jgi:Polysulfide reductase
VYLFTGGLAGLSSTLGSTARAMGNTRLARVSEVVSALLGPALVGYTGTLVADTGVPVWHEGRRELPLVFAGSGAASAGAAAMLLVPPEEARPARRLLLVGAALEGTGMQLMQRRLGPAREAYRRGRAGRLARLAKRLTTTGALVTALAGRRRAAALGAGALVLAGELSLRWAIVEAGLESMRELNSAAAPSQAHGTDGSC